jgi:hypothetical protein
LDEISRRKFLQIAGGITFLSLVPVGRGLFAAPPPSSDDGDNLPLFTVIPYIQPGAGSALAEGQDTLVVAWQTEALPADFVVRYGVGKKLDKTAQITTGQRIMGAPSKQPKDPDALKALNESEYVSKRLSYSAPLTGLGLDKQYRYQVVGNGQLIAEGFASTRKRRGSAIRFAAFGDNSNGDLGDHMIAYHAYSANPDFVMNTGDNVYESGLDNEYARNFFPVYNSDVAGLHTGAPLLRSVPFYTVIANHDVPGKGHTCLRKKGSALTTELSDDSDDALPPCPVDSIYVLQAYADFDRNRDALGYYTAMHLPGNGPTNLTYPTPIVGNGADVIAQFLGCAGDRFPTQANYSFDYGDVHFLCLDSNEYIDPTDTDLQSWIESDLSGTDAIWKIVVFHHPPFNVGCEHYEAQHMRVLAPLFEKHGIDIALHGHEHTYQRTMPIKFMPTDVTNASATNNKNRRIPGVFTIDTAFDGITNTRPDGIIYIVTGAGGKELYEPDYSNAPENWLHSEDNNVAYVSKFYSRKHSLTIFDVDGKTLQWKQVNETGHVVDQVTVTKA